MPASIQSRTNQRSAGCVHAEEEAARENQAWVLGVQPAAHLLQPSALAKAEMCANFGAHLRTQPIEEEVVAHCARKLTECTQSLVVLRMDPRLLLLLFFLSLALAASADWRLLSTRVEHYCATTPAASDVCVPGMRLVARANTPTLR